MIQKTTTKTTRDDIMRAFWFHLDGFYGVTDEINDVKRLLNGMGSLSSRRTISLPFGADAQKKKTEKALFRLLRIGVISDYEVDFGARKFTVIVEPFELEQCKKLLLDYISAAQPAKSKIVARQLNEIESGNPKTGAFELSRILIEFIYDVVERSRRRMIQESVFLARSAYSDVDVRTRLLDYLQEGLGAERSISFSINRRFLLRVGINWSTSVRPPWMQENFVGFAFERWRRTQTIPDCFCVVL